MKRAVVIFFSIMSLLGLVVESSLGAANDTVLITETLMDSRALLLTPNTESIYVTTWFDLKDGPQVLESPPDVLGLVDDFWFHYVTDIGNAGPDKGKGGKYLFLPPGYMAQFRTDIMSWAPGRTEIGW
jgi:hypothetical protein